MTGIPVPQGALFCAETKRRVVVPFDAALRALTEAAAADLARVLYGDRPALSHPSELEVIEDEAGIIGWVPLQPRGRGAATSPTRATPRPLPLPRGPRR
jgi:hypothetical protein